MFAGLIISPKTMAKTATAVDGWNACSEVHEPVLFYHTETM